MENKNIYAKTFRENFIYFLFFLPYMGTGIPAYVICILYMAFQLKDLRFKMSDVFFLCMILLWFVLKLMQSDPAATAILLRYYLGFYIFYLFFNNFNHKLDLEKLLVAISIATIAEAVLINTVIPAQYMPNFPKSTYEGAFNFETKIMGFYQRPYGIGNNASITGTLIMVLLFTVDSLRRKSFQKLPSKIFWLATAAIFMLASGVGLMIWFLFLVFKIQPFKNAIRASFSLITVFLIYYLLFVVDIGAFQGLEKISSVYINFLVEFKAMQIEEVFDILKEENGYLIGEIFNSPTELIIWSDFAWLNLINCTGYLGFGITVAIIIIKFNRYNQVPLWIFVLGTLHYSAMYALPGQMLLGYFFSTKFKLAAQEIHFAYRSRKYLKPVLLN